MPILSTLWPNHVRAELMKCSMAMNAMRLTAMFATRDIEADAPALMASMMLRSFLKKTKYHFLTMNIKHGAIDNHTTQ